MAWATEPSPSPAAYPSPNPFYVGNALSNLVSNYQQAQQGAQQTQQNDYRLKQDQQQLALSKAFAGGLPTNPDGTTNYAEIMRIRAENGNINSIESLAPLIQQQQNLQGDASISSSSGGGASSGGSGSKTTDAIPSDGSAAATLADNLANRIESKGQSDPYDVLGPVTKSGDRAYGKYQVMGDNIPSWTKEVLGEEMTPDEFLADPKAQDEVARAKLGQYLKQTGSPPDAASMWLTGKPLAQGANIADQNGMTGGRYAAIATQGMSPGGGTQVASAGASDAPAYASPDKPSIPPVSAAAGSTIPRENSSTAVGAVGGSPQQSQGGPIAANNPAWAGINASLPVGPTGAPAQAPSAPAPRAPARPFQGSVASIASSAGVPPQVAANIAKAVGVAPGAPLTPEQAIKAQLYVKNYAQRTGQQQGQQQQPVPPGQGQPQGGQGQPPGGQPLVPQIRLPNGITDPMAAVQAINQDINKYAKFTAGQGGEVARERIRNLEWQRDQIMRQSAPVEGRPGQMYLDPRTAQPIAQVPYPGGSLTPAAIDQGAEMYYQTGHFPTGMGRGVQGAGNIQMIMDRAQELHPNEPIESWPARQQAFAANTAGERTLSTRAANFTLAENSASSVMPRVIEASRSVDRTKYPDINKIIEMAKVGTGDPNMIRFGIAAETLAQAYATALTPVGKSTVSMQDHARELMNKAWSQGQIEAAVDQMSKEISSEKQSLNKTRAEFDLPPLKEEDSGAGSSQGGGSGQSAAPSGVTSSGIKWSVH